LEVGLATRLDPIMCCSSSYMETLRESSN
jgi:hypothetical protein